MLSNDKMRQSHQGSTVGTSGPHKRNETNTSPSQLAPNRRGQRFCTSATLPVRPHVRHCDNPCVCFDPTQCPSTLCRHPPLAKPRRSSPRPHDNHATGLVTPASRDAPSNDHEAAGLNDAPRAALVPPSEPEEHAKRSHQLEAHELTLVSLGLGGPRQEHTHVLGHLSDRGRCAVLVLDRAFANRRWHADPAAREVGVVVLGVARLQTSGHVLVSGE
mmetsp:Transcript_13995/g.28385  ORF Transcript_13995/g.28385 Transcript_13995/m.28385 type:complete len:217 (-) Transcript_13995:526-1176(-)